MFVGAAQVTNCALKCPARCPLLEYCIAQCQQCHDIGQASWLEIGPVSTPIPNTAPPPHPALFS